MTNLDDRARRLLLRPGAWVEQRLDAEPPYALRLNPDRRRRPVLEFDEVTFRALAAEPGLIVQSARAWRARPGPSDGPTPEPGRPGMIQGRRQVMTPDGRWLPLGANLTQSPIAWLARRRDLDGQPWLNPLQAAAGERLRADAELASLGQRLTANHDALPRTGSGGGRGYARHPTHIAAARRVARALAAVDPLFRPMVEAVCVNGSSLQLAENDLGVRRREGKLVLREGLAQLARHYGA
ncbi:DUF6456 domain-containing protein [Brevundimonas lutea]|uniref:DUF6456 domain-containing protein n=1 Tax=Brevundimonas lutea TaxID=2293980 RepID=UPI000F020E0B|nr:DUF6456 domain-containing protein [Brevundimonas lutea]